MAHYTRLQFKGKLKEEFDKIFRFLIGVNRDQKCLNSWKAAAKEFPEYPVVEAFSSYERACFIPFGYNPFVTEQEAKRPTLVDCVLEFDAAVKDRGVVYGFLSYFLPMFECASYAIQHEEQPQIGETTYYYSGPPNPNYPAPKPIEPGELCHPSMKDIDWESAAAPWRAQ